MGSLFKSPSVPEFAPVTFQSSSNDVAKKTQQNDSNNDRQIETEQSQDDNVRNVVRRVSRGRNSTIQTSYRGVLNTQNPFTPKRKNLLGE